MDSNNNLETVHVQSHYHHLDNNDLDLPVDKDDEIINQSEDELDRLIDESIDPQSNQLE